MKRVSLEKHFISLSKDSFIYGLGNAVLYILMFLAIPVLTRIFSPADYGLINFLISIIAFLNLVLIFGMDSATVVSFFQYKKEGKIVVSSGFWFLFFWGLVITALASLLAAKLSFLLFHNYSNKNYLIIAFFGAYSVLLLNYFKTVFRLEFKAKYFALTSIVNAVLVVGSILLFTAFLKLNILGYFLGSLSGNLISFFLALVLVRKNLSFRISMPRLKEMLAYGSLLLPASVFYYVFDLIDRFFINKYWNLDELGLYAVAINLTALIGFFSIALSQAWSPFILKMYFESKNTYKRFVSRIFVYYLIFFVTLALLVTIFSSEILRLMTTSKFFGANRAIVPLSLVMVFLASTQITILGISIARKIKYIAAYSFTAALLNIGLNFLLIPKYGMVGAAWATAITYLFLTVIYLITSQKLVPLAINWLKIVKLGILSVAVFLIFPLFWHYSFWINISIKLAEILTFLTLIYFLGIIEKNEIQSIKLVLKRFVLKISRKS